MDITKKNLTYFKAAGKIALLSTFHKGRGVQVGCVIDIVSQATLLLIQSMLR